MFRKTDQVDLFRKRSQIKKETNPIVISRIQWFYIKSFVRQKTRLIKILLALIFFVTLIEILTPIFIDVFLKKFSYRLDFKDFYLAFFFLIVFLIFYLISYYFAIKIQKEIIIKFVNKLREDWLKLSFNKNIFSFKNKDKGKILVKISYHLSLLQSGLNNCFFNVFQWIILFCGVLLASAFIDTKFLIISIFLTPVYLLVFFIGFILSSSYIAQDQTLYSKILQYVSDTFNNFAFNKMNNYGQTFFKNLNNMVEVDSYFRVKREIYLNFGNKIIFVFLTILSALIYIINIYFPVLRLENSLQYISYIIISALFIKLLYLSLQIGLFYFPLKLGLCLSVPEKSTFVKRRFLPKNIKQISFFSNKIKLNEHSSYSKKIKFVFESSKKYLIQGESGSGKTLLANVFAGTIGNFIGQKWVIKINNNRILYKNWESNMKNIYYVNPFFYTEAPIYDILKEGFFESEDFLAEIQNKLVKFKDEEIFKFLFNQDKFIGSKLNKNKFSFIDFGLIQILFCIMKKPDIVIIDNLFLDINHDKMNRALEILSVELKEKIIILFSSKNNELLNYDQIFKI